MFASTTRHDTAAREHAATWPHAGAYQTRPPYQKNDPDTIPRAYQTHTRFHDDWYMGVLKETSQGVFDVVDKAGKRKQAWTWWQCQSCGRVHDVDLDTCAHDQVDVGTVVPLGHEYVRVPCGTGCKQHKRGKPFHETDVGNVMMLFKVPNQKYTAHVVIPRAGGGETVYHLSDESVEQSFKREVAALGTKGIGLRLLGLEDVLFGKVKKQQQTFQVENGPTVQAVLLLREVRVGGNGPPGRPETVVIGRVAPDFAMRNSTAPAAPRPRPSPPPAPAED